MLLRENNENWIARKKWMGPLERNSKSWKEMCQWWGHFKDSIYRLIAGYQIKVE